MAEISRVPLRIVLFGPSGAGKTSLVGVLAQSISSAPSPPGATRPSFTASATELEGMLKAGERPAKPLVGAIILHSLSFLSDQGTAQPVEVLDCAGDVAEKLLKCNLQAADANQRALADEVILADVLVLAIDAASSSERLDELFSEASRFLEALEEARGSRTEISGLPVFLVLTHCDQLARQGDGLVAWLERVEEQKRSVEAHFHHFLSGRSQGSFGAVRLRLWATAIRRPQFAGTAARSTEPFGVTELFRQCCEEGLDYRIAQHRSSRRLVRTVSLVGALVVVLLILSLGLLIQKPPPVPTPLERRVSALRSRDKSEVGKRLSEPVAVLQVSLKQLAGIRADDDYPRLPERDRDFVRERESELERYLAMRDRVLSLALQPALARSLEDLETRQRTLVKINLPADWAGTPVAEELKARIEDAKLLHEEADAESQWFDERTRNATRTLQGDYYQGRAIDWSEWNMDAATLLSGAPHPEDVIKGTRGLHKSLVLDYPEVVRKAARWAEKKKQLELTKALVVHLSLIPGSKPGLLSFDEHFTLDAAKGRLPGLESSGLLDKGLSLDALSLGPALCEQIDARARSQHDFLMDLERAVLLKCFRDFPSMNNEESPQRWNFVKESLPKTDNEPWVQLAAVLARVEDPRGLDPPASTTPVADLRTFLGKASFSLWPQILRVEIPEGNHPLPGAQLRIIIGRGKTGTSETMVFDLAGDGGGTAAVPAYLFRRKDPRPDQGTDPYLPGDDLRAELVVDKGQQFTWNWSRTSSYQFEAINRPPWKHSERSPAEKGTRAMRVRLRVMDEARGPSSPWPVVPDLLPDVRK